MRTFRQRAGQALLKCTLAILVTLAALGALAAAGCPVVGATTLQRAPLSAAFKEWRADQTSVSDVSSASRAEGVIPAPVGAGALGATSGSDVESESTPGTLTATSLPSSYDLRDDDGVTAVRNQGSFGTCWTFASLGSLESTLLVSDVGAYDFSEDNMARQSGFSLDSYDGGGNTLMSTAYLARWTGPVLESDDAYGDYVTPSGLTAVKHVQDVIFLPERAGATDNDAIKAAVMEYGAVSVSFYWQSTNYKSSTASYYRASDPGYSNHAVAIVGWDDGYAASNFAATPAGSGAFLVRNSWGTSWGDSGYFWISYYDATLARGDGWFEGDTAVFTGEDADNYDSVYQYDPLGFVYSCYVDIDSRDTGWMANRFTASDSGSLDAVSFYALGDGTAYEVYAGTSLDPESSDLVATGTLGEAGYHTIALTTSPSLSSGEVFYVMVRIETPGCTYPIALEGYCSGYSQAATSSTGQSYTADDASGSPGEWEDIGGSAYAAKYNVCVKAFVTESPRTTASGLASSSASGWVSDDPVAVTLSASGGTGASTTYYAVDGGGTQTYSAAFDVSGEGSHEVTYWSVDESGATENPNVGYVNIDTQTPTIAVTGNDDDWHETPVKLTLTPSTGPSGAASVEYRLDSGEWTTLTKTDGAYLLSVSADGEHVVSWRCTSGAGLVSEAGSCTVRMDTTAPTVTIAGADTVWHVDPVEIAVAATTSANYSLVALEYSTDGGSTWTDVPGSGDARSLTVSANGVTAVTVRATDSEGVTATDTATVKIDTVTPRAKAKTSRVTLRRGKAGVLRLRVVKSPAGCGAARIKVRIYKGVKMVRSFTSRSISVNSWKRVRVTSTRTVRFAKGRYVVKMQAIDTLGNRQAGWTKVRVAVR